MPIFVLLEDIEVKRIGRLIVLQLKWQEEKCYMVESNWRKEYGTTKVANGVTVDSVVIKIYQRRSRKKTQR